MSQAVNCSNPDVEYDAEKRNKKVNIGRKSLDLINIAILGVLVVFILAAISLKLLKVEI